MDEQPAKKPNTSHICLTKRTAMGISSDMQQEFFAAMADPDVLAMVRGLAREPKPMPFTGGVFGIEERAANNAIRKMKAAGLVASHREGDFHVYYLNANRFRDMAKYLERLAEEDLYAKAKAADSGGPEGARRCFKNLLRGYTRR